MANIMTDRRVANRVTLPLIVVFVLTLLAFLPLALPGSVAGLQPVQSYSTPGAHPGESTVSAPASDRP